MQAGDPQCSAPSASTNAASFDERSYSNRSPRLRAPPPTPTYVESSYAPRSSYSYDSQPPWFVSEWQHIQCGSGTPRVQPVRRSRTYRPVLPITTSPTHDVF
ncbi:hypothetical protein HPB52_021723 [Rhipicephalus sanguineus]|uniref:Uncharacterized protein n=1 Tax=Rhipicephalus sanguineus TaxID=34632 RepID=A0A9D4Q7R2_RHISA|nr:hypothetical protein HPB52_021723 [Rhipicephalus sanguineus]